VWIDDADSITEAIRLRSEASAALKLVLQARHSRRGIALADVGGQVAIGSAGSRLAPSHAAHDLAMAFGFASALVLLLHGVVAEREHRLGQAADAIAHSPLAQAHWKL
jgi:hypothetical protein